MDHFGHVGGINNSDVYKVTTCNLVIYVVY